MQEPETIVEESTAELMDEAGGVLLPARYNAGVPRQKLVYGYDCQGRRVSKTVSNYVAGAWQLAGDYRFLYDGWNLMAIWDGTTGAVVATFLWGLDLSGTIQGAGGVGGLLAMTVHSGTNAGTYFYAYDGNGNVVGLVNAATGQWAAQYEYGPFGEPIRATGPVAFLNPFRFSTKYCDDETGHYYYGYRYYSPTQGRWLSRDPIGERGGANLYGIVDNNPVNHFDAFGLQAAPLHVPLQPGPPIIVLPPSGVPPPNIIPFPLLPKPIGPPQVAACIVVALAGWEVGYAIGDKTGLHSWLGDKLAQCLCRDKKFKTETCRKIKDWSDPETGRRFCVFRCDYSEERITREGADCDKDRFFRVVPDE